MTTPAATTATPNTTHPDQAQAQAPVSLPRLTIAFCTQCRWNLRAAYYAQELLQTFGTAFGEVALVPSTGGEFVVALTYYRQPIPEEQDAGRDAGEEVNGGEGDGEGKYEVQRTVLWDRKVDGGFPETKVLKGRVRDLVEPGRGLGHTDRALRKGMDKQKEEEKECRKGDADGVAGVAGGSTSAPASAPASAAAPAPAAVDASKKDAEGNAEGNVDDQAQDCQDCR